MRVVRCKGRSIPRNEIIGSAGRECGVDITRSLQLYSFLLADDFQILSGSRETNGPSERVNTFAGDGYSRGVPRLVTDVRVLLFSRINFRVARWR